MPVYNARRFVQQSVESILGQTYGDFEFLIYDDGSTDGTVPILKRFAKADRRIRLSLESHAGYTTWLNRGLEASKGEFIARMDADDVSLPERFARQVDFLRAHPNVVVVGAKILLIDEQGWSICESSPRFAHADIENTVIRGQLGGGLSHPVVMLRRDAVLQVGGYHAKYEPAEDIDLWLRLAEIGELGNLPERLLHYRLHTESASNKREAKRINGKRAAIEAMALRRDLSDATLLPPVRNNPVRRTQWQLYQQWSRLALEASNVATARKYAFKQWLCRPLAWSDNRETLELIFGDRVVSLLARMKKALLPPRSNSK